MRTIGITEPVAHFESLMKEFLKKEDIIVLLNTSTYGDKDAVREAWVEWKRRFSRNVRMISVEIDKPSTELLASKGWLDSIPSVPKDGKPFLVAFDLLGNVTAFADFAAATKEKNPWTADVLDAFVCYVVAAAKDTPTCKRLSGNTSNSTKKKTKNANANAKNAKNANANAKKNANAVV